MSLLPNEWIENSIEVYNYQHTTKSQAIYWVVLAAVTAALISLPFIYIDISVQGSGVIRPVTEKTEIKAAVTELVDSVYVREGQQVNKGDILLRFRTSNPDYKITYQTNCLNDYEAHLADLTYLSRGEVPANFRSPVRQQEYTYFTKRKNELETSLTKAKKEYEREKILFNKKLISEEEYDSYYFQYQSQQNELASLIQSQISTWQADLNSYRNQWQRNEHHTETRAEGQGHVHCTQPGGRYRRPVLGHLQGQQHSGRPVACSNQPRLHAVYGSLRSPTKHRVHEHRHAGACASGILQLQRVGNSTGKGERHIIGLPDRCPRQLLLQGEM